MGGIIYCELPKKTGQTMTDTLHNLDLLLECWRTLNFDHSFALNFDQGWRAG